MLRPGKIAELLFDASACSDAWSADVLAELTALQTKARAAISRTVVTDRSLAQISENTLCSMDTVLSEPGYRKLWVAMVVLLFASASVDAFSSVFASADDISGLLELSEDLAQAQAARDFDYRSRIPVCEKWFPELKNDEEWCLVSEQANGRQE